MASRSNCRRIKRICRDARAVARPAARVSRYLVKRKIVTDKETAMTCALLLMTTLAGAAPLGPGDSHHIISVNETNRSYLVHVPPGYDPARPTPVVLILHGAGSNGAITIPFTGMNRKSDQAGFIAVYPDGTG